MRMVTTSLSWIVFGREPARRPGSVSANRFPAHGALRLGKTFQVGSLTIETRSTWGHSPGGVTYVVRGLVRTVAIVGDAIFAGSMGGGGISYKDALETNRENILSLPDETVLCPGHGPLTTVGEQKKLIPSFPSLEKPKSPNSDIAPMSTIGFVGVGRMGSNMARHLKEKGYTIGAVYDVRMESRRNWDRARVPAPKRLAGGLGTFRHRITVVTDDAAMRSIFGLGGEEDDHLLVNAAGKIFINCATISPRGPRRGGEGRACKPARTSLGSLHGLEHHPGPRRHPLSDVWR